MTTIHRGIIPSYLLDSLARHCDGDSAVCATRSLRVEEMLRTQREERAARTRPPVDGRGLPQRGIVPTDLLQRIGKEDDQPLRAPAQPGDVRRAPSPGVPAQPVPAAPRRAVHDAQNTTDLPGRLARAEGAAASWDESVNEAYDGLGATWRLLHDIYGRDSLDGRGLRLAASVHYERGYDNAFWNGEQMVFGDGDGAVFRSFTDSLDVIGHELAHGLTQYTCGLVYVAQPGALNESVSDVFGVLAAQHAAGQDAEAATWLVGAQLFTESVQGVALRSMRAPGTAYDDPRLGKDPQPAHMRDYRDLPHDDTSDNGGVHINSGIPNHAFYRFATALGGYAWDRAGQVWFDTITAGRLPKDADFARFAGATLKAAQARYGAGEVVDCLTAAWTAVGVTPDAVEPPAAMQQRGGRPAGFGSRPA